MKFCTVVRQYNIVYSLVYAKSEKTKKTGKPEKPKKTEVFKIDRLYNIVNTAVYTIYRLGRGRGPGALRSSPAGGVHNS